MTEATENKHNRGIVSFVRRSTHIEGRLARAWEKYAPDYLLDIPHGDHDLGVDPAFSLDAAFVRKKWGNDNSLIVEIGTGQGENIIAAAANHPELNFLGLEVYTPGVAHALLSAGKAELRNVKMAQVNAPELMEVVEPGLLKEVWTFFPDPWPKTKHHKRRVVRNDLADAVHAALADGGAWRIATDIDDYALHVHEVMDTRQDFVIEADVVASLATEHVSKGTADTAKDLPHKDFDESKRFDGRVLTNFERKGLDAGRIIHDFAFRKV